MNEFLMTHYSRKAFKRLQRLTSFVSDVSDIIFMSAQCT